MLGSAVGRCGIVCIDGKGEVVVYLFGGVGLEDDVDAGIGGGQVGGVLYEGLCDLGVALLLGDEDVARRRGPLQREQRGIGALEKRGLYAGGQFGDGPDDGSACGRGEGPRRTTRRAESSLAREKMLHVSDPPVSLASSFAAAAASGGGVGGGPSSDATTPDADSSGARACVCCG